MDIDSGTNVVEEEHLPVEETDDSCVFKYGKWKKENTEEARMEYKKSRQNAKRDISSAKEKKQKEWANDLNDSECQNEIFCCCCIFTCDKLGDTNNRLCNYSSHILHQ